jgi:hypothetical protein
MEDPEERAEVKMLLRWWDRWAFSNTNLTFGMLTEREHSQIFPPVETEQSPSPAGDTVYSKIKEKRRRELLARSSESVLGDSPSGATSSSR